MNLHFLQTACVFQAEILADRVRRKLSESQSMLTIKICDGGITDHYLEDKFFLGTSGKKTWTEAMG